MELANQFLGNNLIFIISQPRSGSTLLQRILCGHPEIQSAAETWLMLHPTYAFKHKALSAEYDTRFAAKGVEEFLQYYTDGPEVYDHAIRAWARELYGNALRKSGKRYFLDKTPRYFFIIPDLYRLFPKAKFIFLLRNPLAVLSSLLRTYVKEDWPVLSFFNPDLLRAPQLILDGMEALGKDAIVVRYEDFIRAPEENISDLCAHLNIDFYPEMLDYSHTEAPKGSLNDPEGIHRHTAPSTNSLDKWKTLMEEPQTRYFAQRYIEALGKDVFNRLGYPYEEMRTYAFTPTNDAGSGVFPWEIAIKDKQNWNLREWFLAERYFAVRRKGIIHGTLSASKKATRKIARNLVCACR